jgi:hypothetical protein
MLMARAHDTFADHIAAEHFAKDAALSAVIRAATSPTTTGSLGFGDGLTRE